MSRDSKTGDGDGFLGRWSRKKRATEETKTEPVVVPDPIEDEDLSDEEILAKLELPDPDDLGEGDDFSGFMKAAVPDHLRKRALRKLWLSNPALANLDGLLEYGEDYTDAAMVPEVLNTAYKVGRGFLKDLVEDAEGSADEDDKDIAAEQAAEPSEQPTCEDTSDTLASENTGISDDFQPDHAGSADDEMASEDMAASPDLPTSDAPKRAPRPRMTFTVG